VSWGINGTSVTLLRHDEYNRAEPRPAVCSRTSALVKGRTLVESFINSNISDILVAGVKSTMQKKNTLTGRRILAVLQHRQDALRKYKVRRIGLFGSYSTGRQRRGSDLDFLVEFEEPTFDNFMGLANYLEGLFRKKVDLITDGNLSPHIQPYVEKQIKWHEVG
jgi:predicted nucleotidyltransferase